VTPERFEAALSVWLDAVEAGDATPVKACAAICADASDLAAWHVGQAATGSRWTVSGEPVWLAPEGEVS
jgi:hypothetical protein